jgi:hypothetical protein
MTGAADRPLVFFQTIFIRVGFCLVAEGTLSLEDRIMQELSCTGCEIRMTLLRCTGRFPLHVRFIFFRRSYGVHSPWNALRQRKTEDKNDER